MTDLRQGVTETQHEVLDFIDSHVENWSDMHTWEDQLRMGHARAGNAMRAKLLVSQRRFAIEAAARLIDAADEIGRIIAAGDQ